MQTRVVVALLGLVAVIAMVLVSTHLERSRSTFGTPSASPHLVLAVPTTTSMPQPSSTTSKPPASTSKQPPVTQVGPGPVNPPMIAASTTTTTSLPTTTQIGPEPADPSGATPPHPGPHSTDAGASGIRGGVQPPRASGSRQEPTLTSVPATPTSSGAESGGFGEVPDSSSRSQTGGGGTTWAIINSLVVAGMVFLAIVAVMWRRHLRRRGLLGSGRSDADNCVLTRFRGP
jgi:hypothetical protein